MINFITKYFWLFFLLGLLAGIFLPQASIISPYIIYILMFVLFLSTLKIDIGDVFAKAKNIRLVSYLAFLILILTPLIFYLAFKGFFTEEYRIALLILLVMPAGMAVPVYSTIFGGDKELALILSIITSILCPVTIPLMIYLLAGIRTNVDFFQMFTSLSMIIFIPFISSVIIRKFSAIFVRKTEKFYPPFSIIMIMLIIAGAVAKVDAINALSNGLSIINPLILLMVITILLYVFGYYSTYKSSYETRITSMLSMAYMNSTLAIVFAAEFFGSGTLLLVTLYQIPVNIGIIASGYVIKKYIHNFM